MAFHDHKKWWCRACIVCLSILALSIVLLSITDCEMLLMEISFRLYLIL